MTLRIIVYLILAGLLIFGLRMIWRDWGKAFRAGEEASEERRRQRLQRNKQEAKAPSVVELQQDADGVYRPRQVERDDQRRP